MNEHKLGAQHLGGLLDLRETMDSRGIEAGDKPEIEQQKTAFRPFRQQDFHLFVEPIGGAEE